MSAVLSSVTQRVTCAWKHPFMLACARARYGYLQIRSRLGSMKRSEVDTVDHGSQTFLTGRRHARMHKGVPKLSLLAGGSAARHRR